MKRNILLIMPLLLLVSLCARAQKKDAGYAYLEANCRRVNVASDDDIERLKNLKGNIKKITIYRHAANSEAAAQAGSDTSMFIMFFDKAKRLTRDIEYHDMHWLNNQSYYRVGRADAYMLDSNFNYSNNGEVVLANWYRYDTNDIMTGKKYISFGSTDDRHYATAYHGDTLIVTTEYAYKKYVAKKLVETSQNNGRLITRYLYHPNGRLKSSILNDERTGLTDDYDIAGNLVRTEVRTLDASGKVIKGRNVRNYSYDNNGNPLTDIDSTIENGTARVNITTFKYGNSTAATPRGNGSKVIAFTFNSYGDVIEEKNPEGDKKFDYTVYDKNGNWVKKIIYKHGIKYYAVERVIEYY